MGKPGEVGGAAVAGNPRRLTDTHTLPLKRLARLLQLALALILEQRCTFDGLELALQGAGAAADLVGYFLQRPAIRLAAME